MTSSVANVKVYLPTVLVLGSPEMREKLELLQCLIG